MDFCGDEFLEDGYRAAARDATWGSYAWHGVLCARRMEWYGILLVL